MHIYAPSAFVIIWLSISGTLPFAASVAVRFGGAQQKTAGKLEQPKKYPCGGSLPDRSVLEQELREAAEKDQKPA